MPSSAFLVESQHSSQGMSDYRCTNRNLAVGLAVAVGNGDAHRVFCAVTVDVVAVVGVSLILPIAVESLVDKDGVSRRTRDFQLRGRHLIPS